MYIQQKKRKCYNSVYKCHFTDMKLILHFKNGNNVT